MAFHSDDIMDWEPDDAPVIFHRSIHPLNPPRKRSFEQMSDNSEPLGRDVNNLQALLPSHRDHQKSTESNSSRAADVQPQGRWHWLSYSIYLVYNITSLGFGRAYQCAKRRLRPVLPSRVLSRTLRRLPQSPTRARAVARRSSMIKSPIVNRRCLSDPTAIPAHIPQALCDMPCTYPDTPAGRERAPSPSDTTELSLSADLASRNTEPTYQENFASVSMPRASDPNPLFDELDIIHAQSVPPQRPSQSRETAQPQRVPLVGARSEHNIQPIDTHTPVRPRKNVTFVASPRTGRPVTGTKKFIIGESMDFPSPHSSKNESSFLSQELDMSNIHQQLQQDSRAAVCQLQQEFYSSLNISHSNEHRTSDHTSPHPSAAEEEEFSGRISNANVSAMSERDSSGAVECSEISLSSTVQYPKTSSDVCSHESDSQSSKDLSKSGFGGENAEDDKSSISVPKKEGEDDVFVESEHARGSKDSLHIRKRRSSSSLDNDFGALELSVKPEPLSTSIRRTSARRASLEAKKKEEEDRARAALVEKKAREAEQRRQEQKERALREGIPRLPTNNVIPPLSSQAQKTVTDALAKGMQTQVALAINGNPISRRDIGKVLPTGPEDDAAGWLNDEIISAYLQIIVEHGHRVTQHKRNTTPTYHAFNTYFYTNLQKKGHEGVKRWAKKAKIGGRDLLNVEMVFVPVNVHGNHWTMAIVQPKRRRIEFYDSLHYGNIARQIYQNLKIWLKGELGSAFCEEEWEVREQDGFHGKGGGPTQLNGSDCGVFAITTAKMMMLGVTPMAVRPKDIPLQRQRIVAEVLNGGFTGEFEPRMQFD